MVRFMPEVETTRLQLSGVRLGDYVAPVLDGVPGLPNRFGEGVVFVERLPLAAFVKLDEMTQCAARGKQLPLGIFVLDVKRERFGHQMKCCDVVTRSVIKSGKNYINP
jgi:hypothetical protein